MLLEKKFILKFCFRLYRTGWYDHVQRMDEERLLQTILESCPPERRRKRRPQNSWILEVTTGMREKGMNNMKLIDREEWRRKIKL